MLKIENLRPAKTLAKFNLENGYNVVPQVELGWKDHSGRKVAIVIESLDRNDLKEQALFSSFKDKRRVERNLMIATLPNVINNSIGLANRYGIDPANTKFAVVNFAAIKFFDKKGVPRQNAEFACAQRVTSILEVLAPTDVLILGDAAAANLLEGVDNVSLKRGWVHKGAVAKRLHAKRVVTSLDLETLYNPKSVDLDDEGADDSFGISDLLFFVSRNITSLWAGKLLHSAEDVRPNPVMIDTMDKFDRLMDKLEESKVIALDTETATLESVANEIYTLQAAVSCEKGYVLPIDHKDSPFDPSERQQIKETLRAFIGRTKGLKIFIGANFKFDMRVYRAQLNVPFIHHHIWDVQAGEILLDENVSLLSQPWRSKGGHTVRTSVQNLRNMCMLYGNDQYYTLPFSKEQRATIHMVDIMRNKDAQDYCALDVQLPFRLYELQNERAHFLPHTRDFHPIYRKHILRQMGPTCVVLSHMEAYGSGVDVKYLQSLADPATSPLVTAMQESADELAKTDAYKEVNKELLRDAGLPAQGLFGASKTLFTLTKPAHKQKLFIDVLNLKPLAFTKTGAPQVDKAFLTHYAEKVPDTEKIPEARHVLDWGVAQKLLSTFVKGWIKKLADSIDSAVDNHLRPSFDFWPVVTGRLNSRDPNLQQVPSRGPSAKKIKRQFVAPKGRLQIRYDYSAHEVRMWGNMALDQVIADAFIAGFKIRQSLISTLNSTKIGEIIKKLKTVGDVHIQNVHRFWGEWVDKEHPLRHAVKAVVFGLIYGKGVRALSKDINKSEDEAQEVIDKLWETFQKGAQWLDSVAKSVPKVMYVVSNIGRRRNLYRVLIGAPHVISSAVRRGKNSPVQGMSSEIGTLAAYLVLKEMATYPKQWRKGSDALCRLVHDAAYSETSYSMVIPAIHVKAHMASRGVSEYLEKHYGFKMLSEPEIELEISATEGAVTEERGKVEHKWDWQIPNLLTVIWESLEDQVLLGLISKTEKVKAMKQVLAPWKDEEHRTYLQTHYPLLGVTDLDDIIVTSIRKFEKEHY